jgi:hypothetical protein
VTEIVAGQIRFLGGHSDTKSESTDVEIPF